MIKSTLVPANWLMTDLDSILLKIVGGGTPSKARPDYYQGDIPWMSVKDMNKMILDDTADHITQEAVNNSSTNIIPAGIPIVATRMSLGKIVVARFDSAINQDLKALYPTSQVSREYLVYWYRSIARQIEKLGTGTTVKGIRLEVLRALEFPVAPLAEQKVITEKLDTLLAQVETTKARLERIPQILKRFRQSVLAASVSGRLTEEYGYKEKAVADVCSLCFDGPFGSKLKTADYTSEGVRVVRLENIGHLSFDDDKETYISEEKYEGLKRNTLHEGDVLFSSFVDEEVRVCSLEKMGAVYINKADCFCLRPNPNEVNSKYLAFTLASLPSYTQIKEQVQGVTRPRINLKILRNLVFQFPDLQAQTEIVRRVEQLFAHADTIEQQVNTALARVNNLTQSILAKAFRGELTEQWRRDNPELISGDNSAEALLARIQAERAASGKTARRKSVGA